MSFITQLRINTALFTLFMWWEK